MDKLFSDSETYTKVRPIKITAEQEQQFYKGLAEEIIDNKWSESDVEDIAEDISKLSLHDNGYEIAKSLEGSRNKAYYEIDVEFCEFLDCISWKKGNILENNVKDWVKAHNPQPKFLHRQRLIVEKDLNREKKIGTIVFVTGLAEERACYLIDENPEREGGTIIAYELVESNCKPIVLP